MPARFLFPAALTTIYVVWGSTYLAIRVMVETMPPLLSAGTRFVLAGGIFLAFLALRGMRLRITRGQAAGAALVGTLLTFGGNGLVTVAEQDVPSGLAALLVATVPLWVVVYRAIARERVSATTAISVAIGFVGVALLVLPGDRPEGASLGGALLVVVAGGLWALGSFWSKKVDLPGDAFLSTAWQMLIGGAAMLAVGLAAGEVGDVTSDAFALDSVLALAYLITFGSLLAFTAYVWLLQNAPISAVATYAYVNPVIAIFLGWAILSEEITPLVVAGAAVIVASVAAVVRAEGDQSEAEVDERSASSSSKRRFGLSRLSPSRSRTRAIR